jgi:hypothetical protein
MGFASVDELYNAISVNMRTLTMPFSKTIVTGATSAAGRYHECLSGGGIGGATVLTGTAGVGLAKGAADAGAIPIGPAVEGSSMTKHLLAMSNITPASTLAPGFLILTDIIHVYPSLVLVTTPTTLSNHPAWTGGANTRMEHAKGVVASMLLTTNSSAAGQITLTYKDQDGNDQAAARSMHGPVAAHPIGALFGDTGVTATPGGLAMPFAAGDYGVRQVNSYAINTAATGGTGCIVLHRPVCTIPIALANTPVERDFMTGPVRLPRIFDNAHLGLFVMIGGALTTGNVINGELVFGWN